MGNKATEQAAITHVMALERAAGRDPKDVRASGLPYDVESLPRLIEVKAFSRTARSEALPLEHRQVEAARATPSTTTSTWSTTLQAQKEPRSVCGSCMERHFRG